MPCVFVSKLSGAAIPANSGTSSMLAPICGVPAVSRTTPASLPSTGFACAAAGFATKGETAAVRTRAPRTRSCPCFTFLPPRRSARRGLHFRRRLHRKIRRPRNGLIRMGVRGVHFQSVLAWRERRERQKTLDRDLLAGLLHVRGSFLELHSRYGFVAPLHRELKIRAGLVGGVVRFQVINLHVDAKTVGRGEIGLKPRPDFGGAQHKLAGADLLGGNMLDLVGKDQRAGFE